MVSALKKIGLVLGLGFVSLCIFTVAIGTWQESRQSQQRLAIERKAQAERIARAEKEKADFAAMTAAQHLNAAGRELKPGTVASSKNGRNANSRPNLLRTH